MGLGDREEGDRERTGKEGAREEWRKRAVETAETRERYNGRGGIGGQGQRETERVGRSRVGRREEVEREREKEDRRRHKSLAAPSPLPTVAA